MEKQTNTHAHTRTLTRAHAHHSRAHARVFYPQLRLVSVESASHVDRIRACVCGGISLWALGGVLYRRHKQRQRINAISIKQLQQMFSRLDSDRSGLVDTSEFAQGFRMPDDLYTAWLLKMLDSDDNGQAAGPLTLFPPRRKSEPFTRLVSSRLVSHHKCPSDRMQMCTRYSIIKQSKAPLTTNVPPTA